MDKKEVIKQIINRFHESKLPKLLTRNVELPLNSNKIISVIGARRCGKTYLLYDTIKKIIAGGTKLKNILFLNFEDERLQLQVHELDLIIQAWRELHEGADLTNHYFFFDEIQNIRGWEKFIRRIYDTETKNIFISGSNSAFLSSEIATSLRGRSLPFELFPFSFDEFLRFQNIDNNYYSEKNCAIILNEFKNYLKHGGFPETINLPIIQKTEILRSYFYVTLYKDLIERYQISSTHIIKYFIEKLADNLSKHFSINKIYNQLRSQGLKMDKNLLYQLIEYIENVYLAFPIQRYDYSFSVRSKSDKKSYFIDNGLLNILTHNFSDNLGKLLENAIYIFLKTNYGNIYENNIFYYKDKTECDFVVFDRDKPKYCIQVSYDISQAETRTREIKGLVAALEHFKLNQGYIITAEHEEELTVNDKKIIIKPAYKLMIDNEF